MTSPLGIDATIFLDVDLLATDDDNCSFIPEPLPEQPEDIVAWLDKDDKEMMLSGDCLIGIKPDPLLNAVNIRDYPSLLHLCDTDPDQLGDIRSIDILDTSEGYNFIANNSKAAPKTDKNMNSVLEEKRNLAQMKCDLLEKLVLCDLSLEVREINDKLQVILLSDSEEETFPNHIILNGDSGHVSHSMERQLVRSFEKTEITTDLDTVMPCLQTEFGLRIWFCPLADCRRAFYRYNLAKLHSLKHLDHRPFKCDFANCKWAFFTSFKLRRHQETHSKRKDFACSYPGCNRSFTTIYNLNCHHRCHEKPPVSCTVANCDKKFLNIRACELHLKSHGEEEAPYRCPVSDCGKVFFLYTALSAHTRVHSHKESELRCQWPDCGRIFEHPCRLKQHTLQHTGQRPFMCTFDKCKWAFSTASKLKRHLSTHTNERKFHCTMGTCSKSFLRSQHLKDHTLTHIGQRSFHCDECNLNFGGKSGLYLHMKKTHPKPEKACARARPYEENGSENQTADILLQEAIQSLDVPSDLMLSSSLLPDENLELLQNDHFSTVNLRDLE